MLASLTALHHPTTSPFAIPTSFRSPRRRLGLRIRSDLRSPLLLSSTSSAPPPKPPALLDTLKVLEWHKLCDCVASFAGTSLGREATKKLLWSLDVNYEESRRLLRETAAAVEMLKCGLGGMDFGEVDTDMVKSAIERALRGFPVNGKEAIAVASIIQSADTLQSNLEALAKEDADRSSLFMPLTEVILDLPVSRTFMNSVHKVMDEKGSVKDTASSELKRSREQLRTIETKLYHQMEKLARLETSEASTLEIITVNGRWCLKVVSDQSRKYEGLLLSSGAGSESLVEPLAAVPLNDELQYTRSLANKAEEDVLSKLTDKMLEVIDDIRSLLDSTIQLDVVIARAKYSVRYGGTCPDLSLPEDKKELLDSEVPASVNKTLKVISQRQRKWKFYARGAYHPLLFQQYHENLQMAKKDIDVATSEFRRMRLQGHGMLSNDDIEPAIAPLKLRVAKMEENHPVPVDFTISVKTRVVVVTGPNTGGKTVSLKTVGLAALMAKIGLYVIASEPVQMPWFDAIYADIGDEQSLSQSLSTFSSHLKRISAIQSNSTKQSLVLLDEVGAGTNPLEGAALGMSLLESFAESGAFLTIATTHHGELKTLKYSNHLFENACMEFDEVNLRPTYRILWGVPASKLEMGDFTPMYFLSNRFILLSCYESLYRVRSSRSLLEPHIEVLRCTVVDELSDKKIGNIFSLIYPSKGRSNAINIAERLGLSHSIIDTARKLYGTASAEINEIILDMETFKLDFEHHLQEARQTMMLARQNHENLLAAKHRISDQKLALKTRKSQAVMDTASLARSILRNKLREIHESRKKQIAQTQTTSGVVTSRADDKGDSHQKKGEKEDDIATAVEVCNEHPPSKSGQVENISSAAEHHGSNAKATTARSELPKVGEEVYVAALGKKATILKVETSKGEVMVQANIMKLRLKFGDIGFQNLQR